ncbi:hypothetical protein PG989_015629 [Apiospora arundinis]
MPFRYGRKVYWARQAYLINPGANPILGVAILPTTFVSRFSNLVGPREEIGEQNVDRGHKKAHSPPSLA